jgi:glycosyltransferase involved in cell wall biosynthesis
VSAYTARSIRAALGGPESEVILNGVDTDFFCPPAMPKAGEARPLRLLFVGNLVRRKGADLLPKIMARLGPGFELHYTLGLRSKDPFAGIPNMCSLGRLTGEQLRDAYREADILLFPTRFEGFGYAAAEAMACGTPVVASACSSLPEIVEDGVTGRLCPVDDVEAFVAAIQGLASDPDGLQAMGQKVRAVAVEKFSAERWASEYIALFKSAAGQELGACIPAVL